MRDVWARRVPCTGKRAKKLLGPMYGKGKRLRAHTRKTEAGLARRRAMHDVGVADVWQKMPGRPPYYHNRARMISQVEMPKGWDPNGPKEQTIDDDDDGEEEEEEEEDGDEELPEHGIHNDLYASTRGPKEEL